jgi:TonB family protein
LRVLSFKGFGGKTTAARRARPALCAFAFALLALNVSAQTTPAPSPTPSEADGLNAQVVKLAGERKYAEALPLARRVLELRRKADGDNHAAVAGAHMNLAAVQHGLRDYDESQSSYRRALAIYEKGGDEYAPQAARALDALAGLATSIDSAVSLHERALKLKEKTSGPRSASVASTLFRLGHLLELRGDHDEAEASFKRFVEIREETKAGVADDTAVALLRLGCLVRKRGKGGDPAEFERRADEIIKNSLDERFQIVEGEVLNGKAISKPAPRYPDEARNARAEGRIQVSILIGESGDVLAACAEGGHRALEESAEHAAYAARFSPTTLRGQPVKVRGVVTYNFVLR